MGAVGNVFQGANPGEKARIGRVMIYLCNSPLAARLLDTGRFRKQAPFVVTVGGRGTALPQRTGPLLDAAWAQRIT